MVIELQVVQVWSEIILVISNRTSSACSCDFEIMCMIALHSVQLPLEIFFSWHNTLQLQIALLLCCVDQMNRLQNRALLIKEYSPKNLHYWDHTGMELMNKDESMAASGVDLRLHDRFWKGKNNLQSGRENFCVPLCATSRATA